MPLEWMRIGAVKDEELGLPTRESAEGGNAVELQTLCSGRQPGRTRHAPRPQTFPELATIGQAQLQDYCDDWVQTQSARQSCVRKLTVGENLLLYSDFRVPDTVKDGDVLVFPMDELLRYIVDRHFADAATRCRLRNDIADARRQWGSLHREYRVTLGRRGPLFLTCKNPDCRSELQTQFVGYENQEVVCEPTDVACPHCGSTCKYDGRDFHLGLNS